MKKIYLIIFMMIIGTFQSQIVNIPDLNFKAKLLSADVTNNIASSTSGNFNIKIDTNNNGEIEVSEALEVGVLRLGEAGIANLTGIASFTNLSELEIIGNSITSINLNSNINLSKVYLDYMSQLTSVNVTNCNLLTSFSCRYSPMTSLDLQDKPLLKYLYVSDVPLTSIYLAGTRQITELYIHATQLTSFDASDMQEMFFFSVRDNYHLTSVNFTNANMEIIDVGNNILPTLNIKDQSKLRSLNCGNNNLTSLNVLNCPNITSFSCGSNLLTSLDLSMYPLLRSLSCGNNLIETLDLSQNPEFFGIDCRSNNLKFLNIKNGKTHQSNNIRLEYNHNLVICCDDSELAMVKDLLNSNSFFYSTYKATTYCSFTPGGTYYTLQGNTRYDSNNNGCDSNDPGKALQKFTISDGVNSGSLTGNALGNYSIPLLAGTHTITPVMENPSYFTITPPSINVTFPNQTSPVTQNFCYAANGVHNDLEVVIIPVEAAAPGFDTKYKIIYKNKGNTTQSGNLIFAYNDSVMDYISATLSPSSQSSGTLNWNFTNLLPFETKEITVTVKLNAPTQTPPLNGGDILHYTAKINGATDETPTNNSFTLNQLVVNSFDPNDKTCLEGTSIAKTKVGDFVHYLIRFENTGTANARNIVIKDEIDTSKFDISSLVPLDGSHSYVTRITDPNVVEFIFENIQLPFDDAHNDGYISFKIKTKSTLAVGNSFSNTAKIYFDYNFPIVTNTYTTSVMGTLATDEIKNEKSLMSVYPNPAKDILHINSPTEVIKAVIYDSAGRVVASMGIKENTVNISELPKGNYLIKLFLKDNVSVQKFIKE